MPYSVDKKRSVLAGRFPTADAAQTALDEAIVAARHTEKVATVRALRGMTVAQLCDMYVEARAADTDAPLAVNTVTGYRATVVRHIQPTVFGDMSINTITPKLMADWYDQLATAGVPLSRREYARRIVSAAFSWGAANGHMAPMPTSVVRKRSTKKSRDTANKTGVILPTWRQFATITAHPSRWEDRLLIALLGWGGLRWGEARSLHAEDVDVVTGTIRVERVYVRQPGTPDTPSRWVVEPVKAGNPADVPVPSMLLTQLAVLAERRDGGGLLFRADQRDRGGPHILSPSNFRERVFIPAVTHAEASKDGQLVRVKDLRAFAGSTLVDSGATIVEVAGMLRHDVRTSEKYYLRPTPTDKDRYQLRNSAVGATLPERINSLYSVWLARFPATGDALLAPNVSPVK